jgi:hypothetical protein
LQDCSLLYPFTCTQDDVQWNTFDEVAGETGHTYCQFRILIESDAIYANKTSTEIDADDPYAAFQIPDDLMW